MSINKIFFICFSIAMCGCTKKPINNEGESETKESIHSILKSIEETDRKLSKYGYIESYDNKYPSDVNLYESGVLKEQLLTLLGEKKYEIFLENNNVQVPIEIINESYAFIHGGYPHSFGLEEAVLEIDFITDKISVGILHQGQVFYFTEKEDKDSKYAEGKLKEWLTEMNQNIDTN